MTWDSTKFDAAISIACRHGWRISDCQAARYVLVLDRDGRRTFIAAWRLRRWAKM